MKLWQSILSWKYLFSSLLLLSVVFSLAAALCIITATYYSIKSTDFQNKKLLDASGLIVMDLGAVYHGSILIYNQQNYFLNCLASASNFDADRCKKSYQDFINSKEKTEKYVDEAKTSHTNFANTLNSPDPSASLVNNFLFWAFLASLLGGISNLLATYLDRKDRYKK